MLERSRAAGALLLMLLLALLGARPAGAQPEREAEMMFHRWLQSQRDAAIGITDVELEEETERVIDGPFGARRLQLRSRLTGRPGVDRWQREFLAGRMNGQTLTPEQLRLLERRADNARQDGTNLLLHGPAEVMLEAMLLPIRLLMRMRPVGPAMREVSDGVPYLRFDVQPREGRPPIERVTLWFEPARQRLARTRSIINPPNGASFIVTTDYDRVDGLDVPRRRTIEGTVQTKRRMRRFTMLLHIDAAYRDYRFGRADERR